MKTNSVYPGGSMQEFTCLKMGNIKMGIFQVFIITLVLVWTFSPVIAQNSNSDDVSLADGSSRMISSRQIVDPWYVHTYKIINESRTFEMNIIINGSGELKINNSATFDLSQQWDYQRNITVKDNGILHLEEKSSLISDHPVIILLQDNGQLILEGDSNLKVSRIIARGNSSVILRSSNILPGIGGLNINLGDRSKLELSDSNIINADIVEAYSDSKIKIFNSDIDASSYDISCEELMISSNPDFRNFDVNSCEDVIISDSTVAQLDIFSCD